MKLGTAVAVAMLAAFGPQLAGAEEAQIFIGQSVPFSNPALVDQAVLNECNLPASQAQFIEEKAKAKGFNVVRSDEAVKARKGRVLVMEITGVTSLRTGIGLGHNKQILIKGQLLEDGKEVASFVGKRSSGGGAFGAYKGSCSVLGRCVEALASDISVWLKNPTLTSRIGE